MSKKLFVAALALLALTSLSALTANAQSSCPVEMYGVRPEMAVNKSVQSQIEVTYFSTNDPNVFMSEKAGLRQSASYLRVNTNQFVAQLNSLERAGVASVRKRQAASSFLGEMAQMNLERNAQAGIVNASLSSNDLSNLDRQSEVSVLDRAGDFFRVSILSWFVDVNNGQRLVDYDGIVLMKPGQTAIFKLGSDFEVRRNGSARSYIAVTMRSVNDASLASLSHRARR